MLTIINYNTFILDSKFLQLLLSWLTLPIIYLTSNFNLPQLHLNEQRYHLQPYWAHSIATLLLMTGNASIIVCIVENWNAFIILHVILDISCFTTNVTPSVRPSQPTIHVYLLIHILHIPWEIIMPHNFLAGISWETC